ncbi:MAG: aldehyde:ferredoxin oxidoreductase [Anaerolineales bacterium]|uniref:Aldehyde:ferredoxin oxidoreductase n=1 Tax=Candidatus Desulfolinea nitratireducens TaxID=2841698 RepID=A0A8J6TDQ0_9CHLR|nr:aldehyde:ferredoxin oxidoreductase [Candidatus Desulfolinea nitratireducens]
MVLPLTLEKMKEAHTLLTEYFYELRPVVHGYANRTLHINLDNNEISEKPVTMEMKKLFTGGRGFGLKLLWDAVTPETKWDDPENELIIANGPICGTTGYAGSGKATVVTLSPLTLNVVDSNVGGYFAPFLKFSGFDAVEIQGKAVEDVVIFIDGDTGKITIETAPLESVDSHLLGKHLTRMYADDEKGQRGVSVMSAGDAAEHIRFAIINATWYDVRRKEVRLKQAGRGGTGRVFRDKKIKGIVVRYSKTGGDSNGPFDIDLIRKAGVRFNREMSELDDKQNQMKKVGTANIVEIMDHFDLLPTHNFRYGNHRDTHKIDSSVWKEKFTQGMPDGCWLGCTMSCTHGVDDFPLKTGPYANDKVLVDGPEYENAAGLGANIGNFDPQKVLELNFYCDTYGVDSISFANAVAFAMEAYEEGIITKEDTGGLELNFGNGAAAIELLHQMGRGEGFGVVVGQGVMHMKKIFAEEYGGDPAFLHDIGMEIKGMEISEYGTKESLAQQGGFGLATKGPQHDEAWLIFMDQVQNLLPSFEDKAEALHYFPMWRTWFSLHGLCKLPWNDVTPEDNGDTTEPAKVEEHVENYTWVHEGVTGIRVSANDLLLQSERVYNFQKVFSIRMGRVGRRHDYPPYRAMGPVTVVEYESRAELYDSQLVDILGLKPENLSIEEKMAKLREYRESQYELLLDAVYKRRGWDMNSIPTVAKLKELGMDLPEVVEVVEEARKA